MTNRETTQMTTSETTQTTAGDATQMTIGDTTQMAIGETIQMATGETIQMATGETTQMTTGEMTNILYSALCIQSHTKCYILQAKNMKNHLVGLKRGRLCINVLAHCMKSSLSLQGFLDIQIIFLYMTIIYTIMSIQINLSVCDLLAHV